MKNTAGPYQRASDHSAPTANRRSQLRTVVLSASLVAAAIGLSRAQANSSVSPAETASACATHGSWIDVKTGRSIDKGELFRDLVAKTAVVLLGESHTDVDHHHWQLHTLAALHGRGGNIVIGFEAFPRRLQSVLDDWVEGKLTDRGFPEGVRVAAGLGLRCGSLHAAVPIRPSQPHSNDCAERREEPGRASRPEKDGRLSLRRNAKVSPTPLQPVPPISVSLLAST